MISAAVIFAMVVGHQVHRSPCENVEREDQSPKVLWVFHMSTRVAKNLERASKVMDILYLLGVSLDTLRA